MKIMRNTVIFLGIFLLVMNGMSSVSAQDDGTPSPTRTPISSDPLPTRTPTTELPPLPTLSSVEPTRFENTTGGVLSVYGSGFISSSIVRLIGYGLLTTTFVNESALTAVIPSGVRDGHYDVQVINSEDQHSHVLDDVVRIKDPPETAVPTDTPTPTNTPIPTATNVWVFGQPQLLVRSFSTTPPIVQPGQSFVLTLELANLGNYVAIDVTAVLQSTDLAIAAEGSNVRIIQRIGLEESATISMPLVLGNDAAGGAHNLNFNIDYFDLNGKSYNTQQSVGLTVANTTATPTPGAAQSRLVLTTYLVEPAEELRPGGLFNLNMTISNVGDADANSVVVTLGGEGGAQLQPFALLNSGNVRFLGDLAAGESVEFSQQMIVAGTADSGIYNLPVNLSQDADPQGNTQALNLLVEKPPQFRIDFYRAVFPGFPGEMVDLPIEVVNIGRGLINVSTISVMSEDMMIENGSVYVGALDGGTSGSVDARGIPDVGGEQSITVMVNYLDDFNQAQTYEEVLTVSVPEPEVVENDVGETAVDEADEEETFLDKVWRFIKGLFGLGS